jgi:hypothetical protein
MFILQPLREIDEQRIGRSNEKHSGIPGCAADDTFGFAATGSCPVGSIFPGISMA